MLAEVVVAERVLVVLVVAKRVVVKVLEVGMCWVCGGLHKS
jgi:hypothetical protein